ncbi:tRNA (mnm(5)s(2)U34)-methyltransferase [Dolosicoccus paucivorans]|uniref:16S rRNA (Cytosine(1402)-N(4))-methyltransferase n=1 Tax=Dolosicoccus paucivorans TaxID=84521 RepID=A0A1G8KPU0_9LACT|nr:class I SAM-dependent methyltransferase [Dolosicoccus paucivorans]PMB83952.1 16S rRNA (cytosine(1402)-N(4))-methyltransferase [Dolosicoccus paucivorans]PMC57884.1 16S rRNA (cytosine(1402)-N(4))-methyltransferase [Dolosicoccus paucivorans]SDI45427.1 Putative rRNA methylase [Dolosicoccus paucivorans]
MLNALAYSHHLLNELIHRFPKGTFVDATLGKGNDTYYIAHHPKFQGHVYGFDIQSDAIALSKKKFENEDASMVTFIHDSHAKAKEYLPSTIHGGIFNLGYLPGGDESITTLPESTLESIHQLLDRLEVKGQIILVVYWGHDNGKVEKEYLLKHLSQLNQYFYQVLTYQFINQINQPPFVIVIEKLRSVQ